jgi:hypothetical protein
MLREGSGEVAPSPVVETISTADYAFAFRAAESRNHFRRYDDRADQWGRGLVKNPILVGMLGEIAVCSFLNRRAGCRLSIDTELRARGDGGTDLSTDGIGIEVKTRNPASLTNLYRRVDSKSDLRAMRANYFVFCQRRSERVVDIIGWKEADAFVQKAEFKKSPIGDWWNLELPDSQLEPMSRLIGEIIYRRAL